MIGGGSQRWAVSLADLLALLLGFFVLIGADARVRDRALGGVAKALDGRIDRGRSWRLHPADFVTGEARLSASGARAVTSAAHVLRGGGIRVTAHGRPPGTARFDGWELAAARAAVVARMLRAEGISEARIAIVVDGTDTADADGSVELTRTR